ARGRGPDAVRHYRAALAVEPEDREALFSLGLALRLVGEPDSARAYLQAARDQDRLELLIQNARPPGRRDDPKGLRGGGAACRCLRRLLEARGWYRLALARDPLDADLQKALFHLDAEIARAAQRPGPADQPATEAR